MKPRRRPSPPLFHFDPAWLFLIPGAVLLAATVIIPAQDDLQLALSRRDAALALENHQSRRLERYALFLDATTRQDPTMVEFLASTQLNLAPPGKAVLPAAYEPVPTQQTAALAVEPDFEQPTIHEPPQTILRALATGPRSRLILIAASALCLLAGLLPPARPPRTG